MKPAFIVLEGPDGSGTTTLSALLSGHLQHRGYDVVLTAEATDGPVGQFIRRELRNSATSLQALQLLFCADRAWHIEHIIQPALHEGKTVICDRYALSTVIYGAASGLDKEWLTMINNHFLKPDFQILALPPLEVSLQRLEQRDKDIFEAKADFQKTVYGLYADAAASGIADLVIDSSWPAEQTFPRIAEAVEQFIASR